MSAIKTFFHICAADEPAIYIAPAPTDLQAFRQELREAQIDVVVSLLAFNEIKWLNLHDEEAICDALGCQFFSFPIPDFGTPNDLDEFIDFVKELRVMRNKKNVRLLIHCRGGIGRSSILGSALLLSDTVNYQQALDQITQIRGKKCPETQEQLLFIEKVTKKITFPDALGITH